jgi:hypothetical protein
MVVVYLDQLPFLADLRAHWTAVERRLSDTDDPDVGGRPGRATINLQGKICVMIYAAPVPGGAHLSR